MEIEIQQLKDESVYPSDEVLNESLGGLFPAYQEFITRIESEEFNLVKQWLYYHDGKAWFCKIQHKKKTVLWLTVWDKFFRLYLYFTAKSDEEINAMRISEEIKSRYEKSKRTGKIKPVVVEVRDSRDLDDAYALISYKLSSMSMETKAHALKAGRIDEFSSFVRKVFDEFVAPDYSPEGNATFYEFIDADAIRKRRKNGNFYLVYETGNKIVGAVELRDRKHICLLFVDTAYQRKGIAEKLLNGVLDYVKASDPSIKVLEVNSSPYAKEIYEKMGFTLKSGIKEQNGIKYYALEYGIS